MFYVPLNLAKHIVHCSRHINWLIEVYIVDILYESFYLSSFQDHSECINSLFIFTVDKVDEKINFSFRYGKKREQ